MRPQRPEWHPRRDGRSRGTDRSSVSSRRTMGSIRLDGSSRPSVADCTRAAPRRTRGQRLGAARKLGRGGACRDPDPCRTQESLRAPIVSAFVGSSQLAVRRRSDPPANCRATCHVRWQTQRMAPAPGHEEFSLDLLERHLEEPGAPALDVPYVGDDASVNARIVASDVAIADRTTASRSSPMVCNGTRRPSRSRWQRGTSSIFAGRSVGVADRAVTQPRLVGATRHLRAVRRSAPVQ